jgi:hypothetical protein
MITDFNQININKPDMTIDLKTIFEPSAILRIFKRFGIKQYVYAFKVVIRPKINGKTISSYLTAKYGQSSKQKVHVGEQKTRQI